MFWFDCSIDFDADRPFDELTEEISHRYLGGLRFIPADRRDTREFTRAEFAEYALFNHDVDLIWDDSLGHFRMSVLEGANEEWFPDPDSWQGWRHGSLERWLHVLLRQIKGVRDIRINPNTAGPYLDVWQTKVRFISRRTVQEVGALLAQKLFCGFRFVPKDGQSMREARSFRTEHELLGHEIELTYDSLGYHVLSIQPSASFLKLLTAEEQGILRGLDISAWVKAPFKIHPVIGLGRSIDDD